MKTLDAANFFGSKTKLAAALGIQPSAVSMWGEVVPVSRQYQIQILSGGVLTASGRPASGPQTNYAPPAAEAVDR